MKRRRPIGLVALLFLSAAVCLAPVAHAAQAAVASDDSDLSLASVLAGAPDRRPGTEILVQAPGAVLAALAGTDTFPVTCATPLVLLLTRPEAPLDPGLSQVQSAFAVRPVLETERTVTTRDGAFTLHFAGGVRAGSMLAADRDRDGLPDGIARLSEALVTARSYLTGRLGYPPPAAEGGSLDVYLVSLGHGLEGLTTPGRAAPGAAAPSPAAFVVLDADLPADRIMPAALHQVAHASLMSLSSRAPLWWSEGTASFLTVAGTGDLAGFEAALRERQRRPERGLAADGMLLMQGALLWPQFLAERAGDASVVRQVWSEVAASGADPLEAADLVLRRSAGTNLGAAFREFVAWNLFTGSRDDGRHYAFGTALPDPLMPTVGPGLPLDLDPVGEVAPLGSVAFRLPGDARPGSLDLEVRADGGRPAADLLVVFRSQGPARVLIPVPLDAAGVGRVLVPWSDAADAWIVLRNESRAAGDSARFQVRGLHDPLAPYDLASFTAQGLGAGILLEWTTASEKGLLGWNLYRSESPTGPFARLDQVAIPAYGDGSSDTGYVFKDDTVKPGRRYYYLLEGLTELGLVDRSHVVSGRPATAR